jgi:hypothetical protein
LDIAEIEILPPVAFQAPEKRDDPLLNRNKHRKDRSFQISRLVTPGHLDRDEQQMDKDQPQQKEETFLFFHAPLVKSDLFQQVEVIQ